MNKKYIFGNWKMNGSKKELVDFLKKAEKEINNDNVVAGLAVPFTLLETAKQHANKITVSAQNVHFKDFGAYTGEISIPMLLEIGITHVVVGHSERREYFNETDDTLNKKIIALLKNDMTPIVCCGESLEVKEKNETAKFINNQIELAYKNIDAKDAEKTIIAYEPIWAIGTGKTATSEDIKTILKSIRNKLVEMFGIETANKIAIQYGGSVKPDNVKEIMQIDNVNGALVGGASLNVDDYLKLINY